MKNEVNNMMEMNLQFFGGRGSSGGKRSGGGGGGGSTSSSTSEIRGKSYTVGESVGFRQTEKRIMLDNGDRIIPNGLHIIESETKSSSSRVSIFESQKGSLYEVSYSISEYTKFGSSSTLTKIASIKKVKKWG